MALNLGLKSKEKRDVQRTKIVCRKLRFIAFYILSFLENVNNTWNSVYDSLK
jgi:hypothetical protein